MSQVTNEHLILLSGKSATGKTASLRNLPNPQGVMYLNCESNKKLPFPAKFQQFNITDPLQVYEAFQHAETQDAIHTIVIDSLDFMMDMYVTVHITNAADSRKAWGDYKTFFTTLMSQYVAKSSKNVIFIAHTADILNETDMVMETMVKVSGSLMNNGIESFFSSVLSSKKVPIKQLKGYSSPLLEITSEEEHLGFKYVIQSQLTKETVNERIRSPMGMWSQQETYIDNDLNLVLDKLHSYYDA